jgi:hypothetical protein
MSDSWLCSTCGYTLFDGHHHEDVVAAAKRVVRRLEGQMNSSTDRRTLFQMSRGELESLIAWSKS